MRMLKKTPVGEKHEVWVNILCFWR
jgi:hypothetical protein